MLHGGQLNCTTKQRSQDEWILSIYEHVPTLNGWKPCRMDGWISRGTCRCQPGTYSQRWSLLVSVTQEKLAHGKFLEVTLSSISVRPNCHAYALRAKWRGSIVAATAWQPENELAFGLKLIVEWESATWWN